MDQKMIVAKYGQWFMTALLTVTFGLIGARYAEWDHELKAEAYLVSDYSLLESQLKTNLGAFSDFSKYIYENIAEDRAILKIMSEAAALREKDPGGKSADSNARMAALRTQLAASEQLRYEKLEAYHFRQLHYHLPNCESFYRTHSPANFGDDLTDVRETVRLVNLTHKPVQGFEEGRVFSSYRYVYPLSYQGRHVGSVEVSVSMETVLSGLSGYFENRAFFFALDKEISDRVLLNELKDNYAETALSDRIYFDKNVVSRIANDSSLFDMSKKELFFKAAAPKVAADIETFRNFTKIVRFEDQDYIIHGIPLKNISGDAVAYVFSIGSASAYKALFGNFGTVLLLGFLSLLLFLMLLLIRFTKNYDLMVARDKAEEANASKSRFLANMSHEIRTPMNGVIGFIHLLSETPLTPDQKDYLERTRLASSQLLMVINDILDFSKLEAGKLTVQCVHFDLSHLCRQLAAFYDMEAQRKGLSFQVDLPERSSCYMGDPVRLGQILQNLLSNAFKFTDDGEVVWRILGPENCSNGDGHAHRYTFSVTDTGIGINQDQLDRITEPFHQAQMDTNRRYGGTGLGLAIVQDLLSLMNSYLRIESLPGQGTSITFELVLPLSYSVEGESADSCGLTGKPVLAEAPLRPNYIEEKDSTKALKILLAEDDLTSQVLVVKILEKAGYACTLAEDGLEALAKVEAEDFDMILMDCQMPNMDGFQATQAIRTTLEKQRRPQPYILALTANAYQEDKRKCIEAGMDAFMAKPVEIPELLKWVRLHMPLH